MRWLQLLVIVWGLLFSVNADDYPQVQHVRFIAQENNNFLFRGGVPKNSSSMFPYEGLLSAMAASAELSNVSLPSSPFLLYDINLLNPLDIHEGADIEMERTWFDENPDKGKFFHYQIHGEKSNPSFYFGRMLKNKARSFADWSVDSLPAFVETIRLLLTTESPIPIIIYFHCECGCDRTGAVSGAYYMQYMNYTFQQAHTLNKQIAGREMLTHQRYSFFWYCYYLKYAKGYSSLKCP